MTYAVVDTTLDLPTEATEPSDLVHVLMPCMSYACGGDIVRTPGTFQVGISDWPAVNCDACREPGEATLRADMRRQQGQQA